MGRKFNAFKELYRIDPDLQQRAWQQWEKSFSRLMKHHLPLLGAFAWQGYQGKGPGAVMVNSNLRCKQRPNSIPAYYMTLSELVEVKFPMTVIREMSQVMLEYTPEQQLVVLFQVSEWAKVQVVDCTEPSPPICFVELTERLLSLGTKANNADHLDAISLPRSVER